MSAQYKYHVFAENENKGDVVIEKEGIKARFTLNEFVADARAAKKIIEREEAQLKLDEASLQNVINNHPFVTEMNEEELKKAVAAALYNGFKNKVEESKKRIAEFNKAYEEYEVELADIKEQTGISLE